MKRSAWAFTNDLKFLADIIVYGGPNFIQADMNAMIWWTLDAAD